MPEDGAVFQNAGHRAVEKESYGPGENFFLLLKAGPPCSYPEQIWDMLVLVRVLRRYPTNKLLFESYPTLRQAQLVTDPSAL